MIHRHNLSKYDEVRVCDCSPKTMKKPFVFIFRRTPQILLGSVCSRSRETLGSSDPGGSVRRHHHFQETPRRNGARDLLKEEPGVTMIDTWKVRKMMKKCFISKSLRIFRLRRAKKLSSTVGSKPTLLPPRSTGSSTRNRS